MSPEALLELMKDVRRSACFEKCEMQFEGAANVVKIGSSESESFFL